MTDVIFSAQYNTTSNQKLRFAIRAIEQSNVRLSVLVQAPELSIKAIQKTLFPEAIRAGGRFVKFIQKLLGIRLQATKVEHKDIFFYIQKAKVADTGKGLDLVELSTETTTMIVAGGFYRCLWKVFPPTCASGFAQDPTPLSLPWRPLCIISAIRQQIMQC